MNEKGDAALPDVKTQHGRARGVVNWRPAFLKALEECGVICTAADAAQVSVMTVWRERKSDADFKAAYEASVACGALLLEAEAVRRAKDGVRRMKFNPKTGEPYIDPETQKPYLELEYSDALMCLLLKRHFPTEYREKLPAEVNVSNAIHFHVTEDTLRQIQERRRELLERPAQTV